MKTITRKKEEITKNLRNKRAKSIVEGAAFFAVGFILSSCFVLKVVSPFSISLISVSKKNNFLYTAVGSALGYMLFCPENFARYAVAVIIVSLGTFAVSLADIKNQPSIPMLL